MSNTRLFELRKPSVRQKSIYEDLVNNGMEKLQAKILSYRIPDTNSINSSSVLHYNLLDQIDIATLRLKNAILNSEKVCIVADYDADGATSCAIAFRALSALGCQVDFYVPNRFIDGYGLTAAIVNKVKLLFDPNIILTVDNGITSFDGVNEATKKGIECIVTDHHLSGEIVPKATAIINPNKVGCNFPSKALAGCGVIYSLMVSLKDSLSDSITKEVNSYVNNLVDFVAIGTIADVVPLDVNNRTFINMGLNRIKKGKSFVGIYALLNLLKKDYKYITSQDIAFSFAPKINAAGRLLDMTVGISLLISDSYEKAIDLAKQLLSLNEERVNIENNMLSISDGSIIISDYSLVSYDESFHEGVIGIVASRLKEKHFLPTFVFARSSDNKDLIKGSGRSISGVHLKDVLDMISKNNPNLLIKYGGHSMAAGLTINLSDYEKFSTLLSDSVHEICPDKNVFTNIIFIDEIVDFNYLTDHFFIFCYSEHWGQNYPPPLLSSTVTILDFKILSDKHTKLTVSNSGIDIDSIIFNWVPESDPLNKTVKIYYTPNLNFFSGKVYKQLNIKSLEF